MIPWFLGTMGFSYPDWKGPFYPEDLAPVDYLKYFSKVFNSVEIDSTFYGVPKSDVVMRWAAETAEKFKINVKMPKAITHERQLIDAQEPVRDFLEVIRLLGDKLGVVLIQFPPSYTVIHLSELDRFLGELPGDVRFAVEVRHRSWHQDKTEEMLRQHQVAWAATEYQQLPKRIYNTTDFLYVRFIGYHRRFKKHESERIDVTPQLQWWRERILENLEHVRAVYGYFNNDYAGFAPGTCTRFKSLMGFETKPLNPTHQNRLF